MQPGETISYYLSKNCTEQPSGTDNMAPSNLDNFNVFRVWIEDAVQLLPRLGSSGRAVPIHEEGTHKPLSDWSQQKITHEEDTSSPMD